MNVIQIIEKKRRGETHTEAEIRTLVETMVSGETADYQIAAWLMAACIQGLNLDETTGLTRAFVDSGKVLDLSSIKGPMVDKHSTGGVGDKTTLALIPMLAASGVKIAKLSGRGLGFTGGTIDKLEAIPNFRTSLSNREMLDQVKRIGLALSSQTADLAPADGRMYAIRDVTATVDMIALIAASVVSKKIACGAPVIVLDIKAGRGAFMKTLDEAKALAETCREVGRRLGRSISTVISSMDQPLGYAIGHTVEIIEALETLKGRGSADLEELCLSLGSLALVSAGRHETLDAARTELASRIRDGSAYEKFKALVIAQGGDPEVLEDYTLMPQPARIQLFPAPVSGYVQTLDSLKIAQAAKALGAGRLTQNTRIDLGVGVVLHRKIGAFVEQGDTLVELYVGKQGQDEAMTLVHNAIRLSDAPVTAPPLIRDICPGEVVQPVS